MQIGLIVYCELKDILIYWVIFAHVMEQKYGI